MKLWRWIATLFRRKSPSAVALPAPAPPAIEQAPSVPALPAPVRKSARQIAAEHDAEIARCRAAVEARTRGAEKARQAERHRLAEIARVEREREEKERADAALAAMRRRENLLAGTRLHNSLYGRKTR